MTFSEGTEAEDTKSNVSCFSRPAICLSAACFHLSAGGVSIASLNVFGIFINSPSERVLWKGVAGGQSLVEKGFRLMILGSI